MSKKSGTIFKIVAVVAGVAAVGAACYIYWDKIQETLDKYKIKERAQDLKTQLTEKIAGKKNDDFFDDAEFFDENTTDDSQNDNRGYISLNTDENTASLSLQATEASEEALEDVLEETADAEVDAYENEGLSDVSEDEDVLAEEASLEGEV